MTTTLPPLSLYVHMPWCVSKCPYCDFNSHALAGELPARGYLEALIADLDTALPAAGERRIASIFFGGGTPSLFAPADFARLIQTVAAAGCLAADAEITLEANPGTVERHRFADYGAAGINRVSLGGQTFDQRILSGLGRIHGPAEIRKAAAELHAAGLENFNIDLMFALPGQTLAAALADVDAATALAPAHVSHYQLTIEPNTAFARRPPVLPDEDSAYAMQSACQERLAHAGFGQYEVSAFSRAGAQCSHNVNYWEFGDYLGVGAGAHQKLTLAPGVVDRSIRRAHPSQYMRAAGSAGAVASTQRVSAAALVFEFMLNALRLREGFEIGLFEQRAGQHRSVVMPTLEHARERGLMTRTGSRWRTSETGWRFLNDVQALFLSEGEAA